jgi:hypothetical protein
MILATINHPYLRVRRHINLYHPFVPAELIACIFFIFRPSKIRVSPTGVASSISPPRCRLSSGQHRHAAAPCHTFFPLSQDELTVFASSFGNALYRRLPSRAETEVLNSHHRCRLLSPDRLTLTLHCYRKDHFNFGHSPHHSIASPFYLLPSQSITLSELHPLSLFAFNVVLRPSSLCTTTLKLTN